MARSRRNPLAALARFARARQGATAVEFAIVALPFMILLFGIIELGTVFLVSATLDNATDRAARMIRTGEFQTSGNVSINDFKALVCQRMAFLSSPCVGTLKVNVRTFNSFNDVSAAEGIGGGTFDEADGCWSLGKPTDIVLVETRYEWTLFTPLLDRALENMGDGKRAISSIATFRNEPYSDEEPVGAGC